MASTGGLARLVTKRNGVVAAVVATTVIALAVVIVRSDGFRETRVDLNDAGVWVTNLSLGRVGRINTQIGSIEVAVKGPDAKTFDVMQVDDSVMLSSSAASSIQPVDVSLATVGEAVQVPQGGRSFFGGPTGAVVDPRNGNVWAAPRADLARFDTSKTPRVIEAGAEPEVAVGLDGTVYAAKVGDPEIRTRTTAGASATISVAEAPAKPKLTAVGSKVVVLDPDSAKLYVGGTDLRVDLGGRGRGPVLQQPGPETAEVLVTTDDEVVGVDLKSGTIRSIAKGGSGGAVAPVFLGGCAFAAWNKTPRYVQSCPGVDVRQADVKAMPSGGDLVFRVNRNRVVLNDASTGVNLLFTDRDPIEVNNWQDALIRDDSIDKTPDKVVQKQQLDCTTPPAPPKAGDVNAGTRVGRPVIIRPLENATVQNCDVPVIDLPDAVPPDAGAAVVVENGTAVQFTPAADRTAPVSFGYRLRGQTGEARGQATIEVVPEDQARPPILKPQKTVVESGRQVRHNVLKDATSPTGDILTLVDVKTTEGTVAFQANGELTYTSAGGAAGLKELTFTAEDEHAQRADGVLQVQVQPAGANQPPTARNQRVVAFAGKEGSVDLRANATDPNGDDLVVTSVETPAGLEVKWEERGLLRVKAAEPSSFVFTYEISDGAATSKARVRVDVLKPGENVAPIPVRDDVIARPGQPAVVDLLNNDSDLAGNVLAVTGLSVPDGSSVLAELLDMRIARVTVPAGFEKAAVIRYDVSNGFASATGVLIVRPFPKGRVPQSPITQPDAASVRAGNATTIRALANDVDPEGERLKLTKVEPLGEGKGTVFIEGDELRYKAPPGIEGTFRTTYTVESPAGYKADGEVTIRVLPADPAQNRPPDPPNVEARVFEGKETEIRIPLVGVDP